MSPPAARRMPAGLCTKEYTMTNSSTPPLLPIGLEIPCSGYAVAAPVKVPTLGTVNLDFRGGIKVRVEADMPGGLGGRKLKVIGAEWRADHPVLGEVVITQRISDAPLSTLEVTGANPPQERNVIFLDLTMTIEKWPGGGPTRSLYNPKSFTLHKDALNGFPPQGEVYQLREPVDFMLEGTTTGAVVQFLAFPLVLSHNP